MQAQLQHQLGDNTLQGCGEVLQEAVCTLIPHPAYGALSAMARIHRSWNQGVEMGVGPLTLTPNDPLAQSWLPVPTTLCSAGRDRGLSSKARHASTRRHNNDSSELKIKPATRPLWASHASESTDI